MSTQPFTLQEILHRSFARYLALRPQGLQFPRGDVKAKFDARICRDQSARTFYRNRKPVCRSLDGFRPLRPDHAQHCAECRLRDTCTPQIRLELEVEGVPYYLVLSYTSLRNFLVFKGKLNLPLGKTPVTLTVLDRGRWGEVTFKNK